MQDVLPYDPMNAPRTLLSMSFAALMVAASTVGSGLQMEAEAAPRWATAARATIHPGVQTRTDVGQCTSNFVFYDRSNVYIGQAAHCSSTGPPTDVNGCEAGVLPLGSRVRISGASYPGVIVYNSWITMQKVKEKRERMCLGNDFALVRIDPRDRARVNPSIPFWGGPKGIDSSTGPGELVYTYGNSSLRQGIEELSPHFGFSTGDEYRGWSHGMYTVTPGVPGDSGSAVLGPDGGALGILSTLSAFPPAQNNASSLAKAAWYMKRYTAFDGVKLANGTLPFSGIG